jgi:hypothetical protein
MKWLIIQRRRGSPKKYGPSVELPGVVAPHQVEAPDKGAAMLAARGAYPGVTVDVVAQVSWNQMSAAERNRYLGNYEKPDETHEMRSARLAVAVELDPQETGAQHAEQTGVHCARKGRRTNIHGDTLAVLRGPTRPKRVS